MKVRGSRIERIEIDVSPEDLLMGLQEYFGVKEVFHPVKDTYWDWNKDRNSLVEMKDFSSHGSPDYRESGRLISDDSSLKAYMLLENLRKLMEEKENGKSCKL